VSRVVVVGGGLAGLAAAAELGRLGHPVSLLEATGELGGKVQSAIGAGVRVDVGPTVLTDLGPLQELFGRAGQSLDVAVPLLSVEPALVATFPVGELALGPGVSPAVGLRRLPPSAGFEWQRLLELGVKAERLASHFYARGDVTGPASLARFMFGGHLAWRDLLPFVRHRSLAGLVRAVVRTPELARLVSHFARFLGMDAERAPSVALVIFHLIATRGVAHPRGGMTALVEGIVGLLRKQGVEVETGVRVDGLDVQGGRVTGARVSPGGARPARAVVAAVDAAETARWLGRGAWKRRVARLPPALSARVAWWVVEGPVPGGIHHALHFGASPGEEPLYMAVPTVTDRELAPPGVSVLHCQVHGPAGTPATLGLAEQVRARLEAIGRWPRGRVLAHGVTGGVRSCYGYAIQPGLFGSFRPSQRVPGLANLVAAGGSVFPGPGVAGVIRSGLRAAGLCHATLARHGR
jgi:phytoene dehydrogenase-like protein